MSQLLTQTSRHTHSKKQLQLFASAVFALIILAAVGLAPVDVLHNAAHDTRHSTGFPCH